MLTIEAAQKADGFTFAVVVSKYHDFVTDRLQAGALAALEAAGARRDAVTVIRVPGAFELPAAARLAANTRQFHAIVCLGCLVRGATPHFDFIASAVAHGLTAASAETGVPMSFGVLTTNSVEEALQRAGDGPANKGWEAAIAAVEMAEVAARLGRGVVATGPGGSAGQ
jgi:6,7-dimethyl-8-ribityllumazine synthase